MPAHHSKPDVRDTAEASEADKAARNAEQIETRATTRIALVATAEVVELVSEAKIAGRCTDLSLGGCYVDTITPFPVGTQAKLRLTRAAQTFRAEVVVVYGQVGMGMGLAFTEVRADQFEVLQKWMHEVSGLGGDSPVPATPEVAQAPALRPPERHVLNELLGLLIRKKILTEEEAADLRRALSD